MIPALDQAWAERVRLLGKGKKLWVEGYRLRTEGQKLWNEGGKGWSEGARSWAEGSKLCGDAATLIADADDLWADAVLEVKGNVKLEWRLNPRTKEMDCIVDGEVFRGAPESEP